MKLVVISCVFSAFRFFLLIDIIKTFESRANFIDPSILTVTTMGEMKFLSEHGLSFSIRPCLSRFPNSVLTLS